MKIITIASIIVIIGALFTGCILTPTDSYVTIQSRDLNVSYSFDCDYGRAMEFINVMKLDEPDVRSGDKYNLGRCNVKLHYDESDKNVVIHLKQVEEIYGKRCWGEENPIKLECSKKNWNKLKEDSRNVLQHDSVSINFMIEKM